MNHLSLSLLGSFRATLDDTPLTHFRSAKAQGLLIYLALTTPKAHRRDELAALFWPDEPEKIAKQNLRQSLYLLRKLLGDYHEQFLHITRATVQFDPTSDYNLDVANFLAALERGEWETAVSLYRGDLLQGFAFDTRPFDDWLRAEREHLHRHALNALNKLTTRTLTRADFQMAERFARHQLRLEPWREEAHRQLMQALALQGERSAALAQFETCRAVLADELGVEPAAETETLARRIRETQVKQPAHRNAERRLTIPFVGRKPEFEALIKHYQQATVAGLQIVTLSGKAGMGKTRLTQHFIAWAATQGADVLHGRCFETSEGLSYQPLTHLLRQRVEAENAPDDLLSDLWLSQLTRLLPELRDRYPDLPEPTQEENTARQHLYEAITRLLQALAERRPLLLFIDDWHWADSASRDVLHYAAVRWAEVGAPIMVLLTLRQEAVDELPDLQSWLTQLNHDLETRPYHLNELSQPETTQLVKQLLLPKKTDSTPDDRVAKLIQFSEWLYNETEGQPLFLAETLKSMLADGLLRPDSHSPRSAGSGQAIWQLDWETFEKQRQSASGRVLPQVQRVIRGWLDRITIPARELLTAAAVLTNQISFDHLCRVAAIDQFDALTALDELLSKQLLLEMGDPLSAGVHEPSYGFSHQKVSAMVYAEAGAARRRMLHRRAFDALLAGAAPAAACAHHARNAGLVAETVYHSLLAAHEAMGLFAFRVAITHFETARRLGEQKGWPETVSGADRAALYEGLGRAYEITTAWTKAQETYEAMIGDAQATGATAMECVGLNRLAAVLLYHRLEMQKAGELLKQAQTVAEQSDDRRGLAETEANLALLARGTTGPRGSLVHGERAMKLARELEHPQLLVRCVSLLSYVSTEQRQWSAAESYAEESRQLYTAVGNLVLAADSQRMLGWCQMVRGRPQESLITLQETLQFSQQIENLWGEADAGWKLALTQLELGQYGEAARLAERAVEQTERVGHPPLNLWASLALATVQRTTMQLDAAEKTCLSALRKAEKVKGFPIYPEWAFAELCILNQLAGDWERASDCARQMRQLPNVESLLPFTLTGWYETEAMLRGGEVALARSEVERVATLVGDNKRSRLPLLRSQAVLAQWDGEVAQATAYLHDALAMAQEMGLPGEAWSILGELGKLYAEQEEHEKAKEAYGEAAVLINQLSETIDDEALRKGFLVAGPVRFILEKCKVF